MVKKGKFINIHDELESIIYIMSSHLGELRNGYPNHYHSKTLSHKQRMEFVEEQCKQLSKDLDRLRNFFNS